MEVGNVIPEMDPLSGYPGEGETWRAETGWQTISLCDYYDPTAANPKVMLVDVSALWCTGCRQEAEAGICEDYAENGMVCYTAIFEGEQNEPATQAHVDDWKSFYEIKGPIVMDPLSAWGPFYESAPLNLFIDLRTMRILDKTEGFQPGPLEANIKHFLGLQ
jgi:hypothetical protein